MESSLVIAKKLLIYAVSVITVYSLLFNYTNNSVTASETKRKPSILILGDSLSAAYGINTKQGWTVLLQSKLKMTGFNHKVINVSVSGDTTRTGLNRLKPLLAKYHPDIVIVALGGNDGLRGLAFSEITTSLGNIILMTQQFKSKVLLAGVRLPPNYGAAYNSRFTALFKTTADKFKIRLVPSLLSGIDDKTELMQPDKIHPKAQAQSKIVDNVWQELRFLLR